MVQRLVLTADLDCWAEEPTLRSGHRAQWPAGTHSYLLVAAERAASRPTHDDARLAQAAMAWLFDLLPGTARVCDVHLVGKHQAQRARARPGIECHELPRGGIAVVADSPQPLADFLWAEARHDDAMFVRPMQHTLAPDLQPWLRRDEVEYVSKGIPRYGAIALVCLRPLSLEIVTSRVIPDFAERTAALATALSVVIRRNAAPGDRNWHGWRAWLRARL